MNFLEFIHIKAQQCGWEISEILSDSMVKLKFATDLDDENVYIRPCGKNVDGNTVLEFSSDVIPIPDNLAASAIVAFSLLERNGEMLFGYWGIETINDKKYFTVFAKMIANTMDKDEFAGAIKSIVTERVHMMKFIQKNSIDF